MAQPLQTTGSKYNFLGIQVRGRCLLSNGIFRPLLLSFFYGSTTPCSGQPGTGSKSGLIQAAGGFAAVVMTPLLAALSKGWINGGIWDRWIDTPTDPWQQNGALGGPGTSPSGVGTGLTLTTTGCITGGVITTAPAVAVGGTGYTVGDIVLLAGGSNGYLTVATVAAGVVTGVVISNGGTGYTAAVGVATTLISSYGAPAGDGAVTGDRLPLDNNVTIRKYTAVRGKNWKGNFRPAPIAESQCVSDQLTPAAQALWKLAALAMYQPISDGTVSLVPILVSANESQLVASPTRVAYAPLVLPGLDPVTGTYNGIVNLALGESGRRKEKKTLVF